MSNLKKSVSIAMGATFAATMAATPLANAAENPFGMQNLESGYMQVAEAKCGGNMDSNKDAEGKCGEGKKAVTEGKCGEGKKDAEGKCGEGKKEAAKTEEGKCGEAKCGANN
ncbi:MAG: low-complexity protein [Gammaproteobacteria bacterium]|nr:low-complexity protein [Gammaproteobacteria bacterium]